MIKINDRFSMKRDKYCWILSNTTMGEDKDGNPKLHTCKTYHSNFTQISYRILNMMAGDCESVEELIQLYLSAELIITTQLEEKVKPRGTK